MAGMDHGYNDQAVPGYSIAGAGVEDQDDDAGDVADEGPYGLGYYQAGDSEIVAAVQRTAAHADSVALGCRTSTQFPGADSRFGQTSVPRPVERNHATRRESGYGILVAAVQLGTAGAGLAGLGMDPHAY